MKKYYFIIIAFIIFAACKQETETAAKNTKSPKANTSLPKANKQEKTSDTLVIDKRCAVDYWAPEEKIKKMEKEGGDDFYTAADDVGWYTAQSTTYLDSLKFPIIRTKGYRYIRFKKANGSSVYIDTDTIKGITNIYLFDPAKNPINADITSMEEEFMEYFKKK